MPRTIQDPNLPDEKDELLYFVMVEFNVDDIKELKRITAIELSGTLDSEGLKQFVEVLWFNYIWGLAVQFFQFCLSKEHKRTNLMSIVLIYRA